MELTSFGVFLCVLFIAVTVNAIYLKLKHNERVTAIQAEMRKQILDELKAIRKHLESSKDVDY